MGNFSLKKLAGKLVSGFTEAARNLGKQMDANTYHNQQIQAEAKYSMALEGIKATMAMPSFAGGSDSVGNLDATLMGYAVPLATSQFDPESPEGKQYIQECADEVTYWKQKVAEIEETPVP